MTNEQMAGAIAQATQVLGPAVAGFAVALKILTDGRNADMAQARIDIQPEVDAKIAAATAPLTAQIVDLQGQLLTAQNATTTEELSHQADNTTNAAQIATLTQQVADAQTALTTEQAAHQSDKDAAAATIADLQTKLDNANATIASLQSTPTPTDPAQADATITS